jgi:hypothetical protein
VGDLPIFLTIANYYGQLEKGKRFQELGLRKGKISKKLLILANVRDKKMTLEIL